MKVLILAAGYATRLHPLTITQPKPLLLVAGRPMIEYVMDNLSAVAGIDCVYVVTNEKFTGHFQRWADGYAKTCNLPFRIINDGTTDDSNKLGAIGDLQLVIDREKINNDIIVVAGDNLFSQKLKAFGEFCAEKKTPVLGIYDAGSIDAAKKYGVAKLDPSGRLLQFEEKPERPVSTLVGIVHS